MANIETPPCTRVKWGCKRCGHTGGRANTTFPLDISAPDIWHILETELRRKLIKTHLKQGCVAIPEDFVIERL